MKHLVPALGLVLSICGCTNDSASRRVYSAFQDTEALEKRVFDRLVFTLSDRKMKPSFNFKFVVKDQLGREWMFKTLGNGETSDGEVAAYRLGSLAGVITPEIHPKTFTINGEKVRGTLQRLIIPNLGGLNDGMLRRLPDQAYVSLVKSHLIGWLSLNHHVHPDQFLVITEDGETPHDVMRIDNSVEWFLLGHDRLSVNYATPVLSMTPRVGYARLWRLYLNGGFDLPMQEIYDWAVLISRLPDQAFEDIFASGVENGLRFLANNGLAPGLPIYNNFIPEIVPNVDTKTFIPALQKRKKDFPKDLAAFLDDLRRVRKDVPKVTEPRDPSAAADGLIAIFKEKSERLHADATALETRNSPPQAGLEPETSFAAYKVLRPLMNANLVNARQRRRMLQRAAEQLEGLRKSATHPNDKKSASIALSNLNRILDRNNSAAISADTLWLRQEFLNMNELLQEEGLRADRERRRRR